MSASEQDGTYPRPILRRERWHSLDGVWEFGYDDAGEGERDAWFSEEATGAFDREITVPFPPEAPASGIGETAPHAVVWYRRRIPHAVLAVSGGDRALVHFGAVDHRAKVWLDGRLVAEHLGGQTPFTADVTDALRPGADAHVLVVRAEDNPVDLAQPRGKQDWQDRPHAVWYERTTGIWQTVWTETVAGRHVTDLAWIPDPARGVEAEITLASVPAAPVNVEIVLSHDGEVLAESTSAVRTPRSRIDLVVPALRNGIDREDLLWSPERPTLIDARVTVRDAATSEVLDTVDSYVGLRSAGVGRGAFLLNDRPYYVRSVLNQGYRPDTLIANSGTAELRREVELIKAMGFNAVRVHQKAEDPASCTGPTGSACWCGARPGPPTSTAPRPWNCSPVSGWTWCGATAATPRSSPGCPSTRAGAVPTSRTTRRSRPTRSRSRTSPAPWTRPARSCPTRAGSTPTATSWVCTTTPPTPSCSPAATATPPGSRRCWRRPARPGGPCRSTHGRRSATVPVKPR